MSEPAKPIVPQWAKERAEKIAHQVPGLWPGKLVDYLAAHLALAWQEGRTSGVEAAMAAVTDTFEKHKEKPE